MEIKIIEKIVTDPDPDFAPKQWRWYETQYLCRNGESVIILSKWERNSYREKSGRVRMRLRGPGEEETAWDNPKKKGDILRKKKMMTRTPWTTSATSSDVWLYGSGSVGLGCLRSSSRSWLRLCLLGSTDSRLKLDFLWAWGCNESCKWPMWIAPRMMDKGFFYFLFFIFLI